MTVTNCPVLDRSPADLIFVACACISEGDDHEALLHRDGLYAELYALQASEHR